METEESLLPILYKQGYAKHMWHIHHTSRVIRNRIRFLKERHYSSDEFKPLEQPHRMSKKHPFDCGKTRCFVCHSEKFLGIKKSDRYSWIDFVDMVKYRSRHYMILKNRYKL